MTYSDCAFDSLGRLTSVEDPFGRTTAYTFDGIDRLTSQTDAKGQQTFFEYDPITDRLTKQTFQDDNEALDFFYDRLGRRTCVSHTDDQSVTRDVEEVVYYRDGSVCVFHASRSKR